MTWIVWILLVASQLWLGLAVRPATQPLLAAGLFLTGFACLGALVRSPQKGKLLGQAWFLVLVGIVLRLAFVPQPVSDDVFRYAWEGRMQLQGVNPYIEAPATFAETHAGEPLFDGINHKDLPAAYPPVTMLTFRGMAWLSQFFIAEPMDVAGLRLLKLWIMILDMGALCVLALLLRREQLPAHLLMLYAWNPLVLLFVAGEGHFDGLQVLWLSLALLLLRHSRHAWLGFMALGAAVLTKFFAILAVPFLITRGNWRWTPFLALPLLCYLPFLGDSTFSSLLTFASDMHYDDLLPRLARWLAGDWGLPLVLAGLAAACGAIWLLKQDAPLTGITLCWMCLIPCLPTLHPWYLVPLAALLALRPSWAWLLLQAATCATFWVLHHQLQTGEWREFPLVVAGLWLPWLVALLACYGRDRPGSAAYPAPCSLDVILPTRNEAAGIEQTLAHLQAAIQHHRTCCESPWDIQVWVIDAQSTDTTPDLVRAHDVTLLQVEPSGRGNQMAYGIAQGNADLVLMLHADALMAEDTLTRLARTVTARPGISWGILGHHYATASWKMRLIQISNRLRFHLGGIAFGDQGIFVRRSVLGAVGGMPKIRLMEDVELSLRLAGEAQRVSLGASLQVSTRRWERKRFSGYTVQVLGLVSSYLVLRRLGVSPLALGNRMYDCYYRS